MFLDFVLSYFVGGYRYDYWHCPHAMATGLRDGRGEYLIDFSPKTEYPGPFDAKGIPLLNLESQHTEKRKGVVYNPIVIAQYGLGWHARFLRSSQKDDRDHFLGVAEWLWASGQVISGGNKPVSVLVFPYHRGGDVRSGMAQGLAISVLCRAFTLTGETRFLDKAVEYFRALTLDISEGGVVSRSLGFPVLEEYTHVPHHILNGHLFAYMGIWELGERPLPEEDRNEVRRALDLHTITSLQLLRRCDMGRWSRYSLVSTWIPNVTSLFYHRLHIQMLKGIRILTGIDAFGETASRWEQASRSVWIRCWALFVKSLNRIETDLRKSWA
jgi:heparosan-N-sulfate-glucuronate 5-epimerase